MNVTTDEHGHPPIKKAEGQSESIRVHQWFYSLEHQSICQVIESQTLWGETTCRVWLPGVNGQYKIGINGHEKSSTYTWQSR